MPKFNQYPYTENIKNEDAILLQTSEGTKSASIGQIIDSIKTGAGLTIADVKQEVLNDFFPVGSVYLSMTGINPQQYMGGKWGQIAKGRTLVGVDPTDDDFLDSSVQGGSADTTLPEHTHTMSHTHTMAHTHAVSLTSGSAGAHTHSIYIKSKGPGGDTYSNVGTASDHNKTLNTASAGAHTHSVSGNTGGYSAANTGGSSAANTGSAGTTKTKSNYPPYLTVYIWQRIE